MTLLELARYKGITIQSLVLFIDRKFGTNVPLMQEYQVPNQITRMIAPELFTTKQNESEWLAKSSSKRNFESDEPKLINSDKDDIVTIIKRINKDNIELQFIDGDKLNLSIDRFRFSDKLKKGVIVGLIFSEEVHSTDRFQVAYTFPQYEWQVYKLKEVCNSKVVNGEVMYPYKDQGYFVNVFGWRALLYANQITEGKKIKAGDEIEVVVTKVEGHTKPTAVFVSMTRVEKQRQQEEMRRKQEEKVSRTKNKEVEFERLKEGDIVNAVIDRIENNCIFVKFGSLYGIIFKSDMFEHPVRRIELYFDLGDDIQAKVVSKTIEDGKQRIRLSHKACIPNIWDQIEFTTGDETEDAIVAEVVEDGVYLSIDTGVEGFLPNSEMTRMEYKAFKEWTPESGGVAIYVKSLDKNTKRLIFSRIPYYDEAWEEIDMHYQVDGVYLATIIDVEEDCIWVQLEEDIEARISRNELQWERVGIGTKNYQIGQSVNILLTRIDYSRRCLFASIRRLTPDPWELVLDQPTITSGQVTKVEILDYKGKWIIVETTDQHHFEGRIRRSEVSWLHKAAELPDDALPLIGSVVEAKIMVCQPERRYLELSIRQLTEDPWRSINIGAEVSGMIGVEHDEESILINLTNGLTAYASEKELSVVEGQMQQFKIIDCNRHKNTIIVSHRRLLLDQKTDNIVRSFFNPIYISE